MLFTGLYAIQDPVDKEMPANITFGSLTNIFYSVEFSHETHTHISKSGTACTNCHHELREKSDEPIACSECHSNILEDMPEGTPTLNSVYHRQCMTCHREYEPPQIICSTCHMVNQNISSLRSQNKTRPARLNGPDRLHFNTPDADLPMVTFHHEQHNQLFRIDCAECHEDQSCSKCHSYTKPAMSNIGRVEELHEACETCHDVDDDDECLACHKSEPTPGFSHDLTKFSLKSYHQNQECAACHTGSEPVKALDRTCTKCHSNFVMGEFDHTVTGLELYEDHLDAECYDCHEDEQFEEQPYCSECHDDYSFPEDEPGDYLE